MLLLPVKADLPPISLLLLEDPEMTPFRGCQFSSVSDFLTENTWHRQNNTLIITTVVINSVSFTRLGTQHIHNQYLLDEELEEVLDEPTLYQTPDSGDAYHRENLIGSKIIFLNLFF